MSSASASSAVRDVSEIDKELAAVTARVLSLNNEKQKATLSKTIGEATPEELERYADQLRTERAKAIELAALRDLHDSFANEPNEKVRDCLKAISAWAKDELCALNLFRIDIAEKRKKVGIFRASAPYEDGDEMPYTRAELEGRVADSQIRGAALITSVIELFHELRLPVAQNLQAAASLASTTMTQEAENKKRKLNHARRGCECLPENCCNTGGVGHACKCTVNNIACDQRCQCHSSGKCTNPKNVAEKQAEKQMREDGVAFELDFKEAEVQKMIQLAARAAVAAAMEIDTPKRRPDNVRK